MKHQQVSVDYWAMGKAMLTYLIITVMGWLMLRLFNTMFTLPQRMRTQQRSLQNTLEEFQRRFPGMNITEEDLKNADKDLEELIKEDEEKNKTEEITEETKEIDESKKTI